MENEKTNIETEKTKITGRYTDSYDTYSGNIKTHIESCRMCVWLEDFICLKTMRVLKKFMKQEL